MTTQTGFIAGRYLAGRPSGIVVAVFDRSAYLSVGSGLVCLAGRMLPEGPLMVPYPRPHALRLGERVALAPNTNLLWQPPPAPRWSIGSLEQGMAAVKFLNGIQEWLDHAAPGGEAEIASWLMRRITGSLVGIPQSVLKLVGLGPGSTPSGDDFLGGIMVAMHALGRPEIASALYDSLDLSRPNRISAAHLTAAREGAAAAPLHSVLHDTLCGRTDTLPARLAGLDQIGHSSGRDAFAGCYAALRAYCDAEKRRSAA